MFNSSFRFAVLRTGMRVKSMKLASKLIVCCAILHNLAIRHGDDHDDSEEDIEEPTRTLTPSDSLVDEDNLVEDRNGQFRRTRLLVHFRHQWISHRLKHVTHHCKFVVIIEFRPIQWTVYNPLSFKSGLIVTNRGEVHIGLRLFHTESITFKSVM